MLQATAKWEVLFIKIFSSESPMISNVTIWAKLVVMHFIAIICLLLRESLPKIQWLRLDYVLEVDPFDSLST